MPTLSQCIRKAGKALSDQDAKAITAARDQLQREGMNARQAGIEAVASRISDVMGERGALADQVGADSNRFVTGKTYQQYTDERELDELSDLLEVREELQDQPFKVRKRKSDGAVLVTGDVDAARAALPENLRGRKTKQGLVFSGSAASRAFNVLTGQGVYGRAGEVTKHPIKNGRYVGAPAKYNTPQKIPTLRKRLRQLAIEGEPGRYWYENSSQAILDFVGGDKKDASRLAALIAIYSSQMAVAGNTTVALRAWSQYQAGVPIKVKTAAQDKKAEAAMRDPDGFWSGEKTGNFFRNLMIEADGSIAKQGATIDMWMMRAAEYTTDAPNRSQYAFVEVETNRLANELGWEPQQVQAAVWTAIKARTENPDVKKKTEASSEKKGYITYRETPSGGKVRVVLNHEKHMANWMATAYKHELTAKDTNTAKFDYAEGIRRHSGTVALQDEHGDLIEALLDDSGQDVVAKHLGILTDGDTVAMAPAKGWPAREVDPDQASSLTTYVDTLRQITGAERGVWWRPFYDAAKKSQNALLLDMGAMADSEVISEIEYAVEGFMADQGNAEWRDSMAVVKHKSGAVILNFGATDNASLKDLADRLPDMDAGIEQFAADGRIIGGLNAEQVEGVNTEKQQPILEWARSRVAAEGIDTSDTAQKTEGQEELDYRPGTTPRQKRLARSALERIVARVNFALAKNRERANELRIERGEDPVEGGGDVTTFGAQLISDFRASRPSQIIGRKLYTPEDVALAAQVYRDPRIETFRIVMTKNGKVVDEMALSNRLPGGVSFSPSLIEEQIPERMKMSGADSFYAIHNHPSGKAKPSIADAVFTKQQLARVPGFQSHIVIDFDEYAEIGSDGNYTIKPIEPGINFTATPEIPHPMLGQVITSSEDIAKNIKHLKSDGNFVVVTTNTQNEIRNLISLPLDFFGSMSPRQMGATMRSMLRETGSGGVNILVLPEAGSLLAMSDNQFTSFERYFTEILNPDGSAYVSPVGDAIRKLTPRKAAAEVREPAPGARSVGQVQADIESMPFGQATVVQSISDLPESIQGQIQAQSIDELSGWFDKSSGEVYLVADYITSAEEAQATLLHEAIGHRGIESVMGSSIGEFLRDVSSLRGRDSVVDRAYAKVDRLYPDESPAVKASEVVALIAESNPAHSIVNRAVMWMRRQLRSLGFELQFTKGDIVEALSRAKRQPLRDPVISGGAARRVSTGEQALNDSISERDITVADKAKKAAKRYLAPGGLLPRDVFEAKIARDGEVEAGEMDIKRLVYTLEHQVKEAMGKTFSQLTKAEMIKMDAAMKGQRTDLPESVKTALEMMRQHIDIKSAKYIALQRKRMSDMALDPKANPADVQAKQGLIDTILSNVGTYAHRSYRAYDDPNWPKIVPDAIKNRARSYLTQRAIDNGAVPGSKDLSIQVERIMQQMLKSGTAYDSMEAAISESKLGAKDLSLLKKKNNSIAPEIRAYLGEYIDPRLNFAKTISKMDRLIYNETFLDKIRELGMGVFLFERGTEPPTATAEIAPEGSEVYSPLNGLMTYPDIVTAFKDSLDKDKSSGVMRLIIQTNGAIKFGKTVLSPTTALRNFMSSMFFAIANGHANPAGLITAIGTINTYRKSMGTKFDYLQELKRLGVVYDTPYAGEMMRLLEDAKMQERLISGQGPISYLLDSAQMFYRWGDDFWKIVGFENEVRLQKKHYGLGEQAAREAAAERIRNTYPTYSMVGKAVNSLRRFPLAGTFVSFPAEILRTSYHILRYAQMDRKKSGALFAKRAAGIATVSALAYAAQEIAKDMLGVDDEEEEAYRKLLAPWNKNSNLLFMSRDEGKMRFLDLSFLDPYNYFKRPLTAIMRDQPVEDKAFDVLAETLSPFFGTDIAAGALLDIMRNSRGGRNGSPIFDESDYPEGQIVSIAEHLWKNLRPGVFANAQGIISAISGEVSRSGRQRDLEDELAALVGFRVSTYDPSTSLMFRTREIRDNQSLARTALKRVLTDPNPVTRGDIEKAVKRTVKIREELYSDQLSIVEAARLSGLGQDGIVRQLRAAGASKRDSIAIARGDRPVDVPTKRWMQDDIKSAPFRYRDQPGLKEEFARRRAIALQLYRRELTEARKASQ